VQEVAMLKKTILKPGRVRRINGGFSFIPHRFLSEGFLAVLNQQELVLYFFLVLVSDRNGVSYYRYDAICGLLKMTLGDYIEIKGPYLKFTGLRTRAGHRQR
jgi:hypothetical protein